MAIKKTIYRAIRARIIAKVTEIKAIGIFNSQIENQNVENPIPFPAVFVEFLSMDWNQQASGIQQGTATIRLHVVTETYKTNISSYSVLQDDDDAFFDLVDKIHSFLNGFDGETFGPLTREAETTNPNFDNLQDWTIDYSFGISDDGSFDATRVPLVTGQIDTLTTSPRAIVDELS